MVPVVTCCILAGRVAQPVDTMRNSEISANLFISTSLSERLMSVKVNIPQQRVCSFPARLRHGDKKTCTNGENPLTAMYCYCKFMSVFTCSKLVSIPSLSCASIVKTGLAT